MGSGGGFQPVKQTGGFKEQSTAQRGKDINVGVGDVQGARLRSQQLVEQSREAGFGDKSGQLRDSARTTELRTQLQGSEFSRLQREIDFSRGRERSLQEFGEGKLGRVRDQRSDDIADIIQRRRQFADEGLGAQVLEATRERGQQQIGRTQELQQRQLSSRQAAGGVRGGLAAAQQLALGQQQQQQVQDLERDLFLQDAAQRQSSLGALETSIAGAEQGELGRQQFNLEQIRREALGRLTGQFAEAGLGVAERTSAQSLEAARISGEAGRRAAGGGGKK